MKKPQIRAFPDDGAPTTCKGFAGELPQNGTIGANHPGVSDMSARTAAQLRAEADALYARMVRLRERADEIEQRKARDADQRRRERAILSAAMDAERGASDSLIAARLASQLNGSVPDAIVALAAARQKYRRTAKAQRNRLIMQLAWKGWTNRKIATDPRVNLAEKTVSRIVATRLHRAEWD